MGELSPQVRSTIFPLFDVHKEQVDRDEAKFVKYAAKLRKSFERHLKGFSEFYCDNFDVGDDLDVAGVCNYEYLLSQLAGLSVVPVVGIDRAPAHNESVYSVRSSGAVDSPVVALRIAREDFESFAAIENEIDECLGQIIPLFESVDLLFDCRVCRNLDANAIGSSIASFATEFASRYSLRKTVVAGSSIPASAADLLKPRQELIFHRNEVSIARAAKKSVAGIEFSFGDYTVVSPYYSDANIPPQALLGATTAKVIYSYDDNHYFRRGESVKNNRGQYFTLMNELCAKSFFRGAGYSKGEDFFVQKSKGKGSKCWPSTMLKPEIVSHVTYVGLNSPI